MSWYAIDAVDDAVEATRSFLLPFDRGRWLRLLLVAFLLGGGGGVWNVGQTVPSPESSEFGDPTVPSGVVGSVDPLVVYAGLAVAGLVILAFVVASAVVRFVLLDALRTDEVRIREPFKRRFWKGIRLLVFRVGVGFLLVTISVMVLLAVTTGGVAVVDSLDSPRAVAGLGVLGLLLVLLLVVVGVTVVAAFFHLTTAFVAPTMVATDSGVIDAWETFWSRGLAAHPWQFLVYLLFRVVVNIAVGVFSFVASLAGLLAVGIVAAVAVGVVALAFGGLGAATSSTAGLVVLGVLAVVFGLAYVLLVALPVRVVVLTFLTTYELRVLGWADPSLAILADELGDGGGGVETGDGGEDGSGGPDDLPTETGGFEFGLAGTSDGSDGTGDADGDEASPAEDGEGGDSGGDDSDGEDGDGDDGDDEDDGRPFWAS